MSKPEVDIEEFVNVEKAQDHECSICLTVHLDEIYEIPCGHFFCRNIKDVSNQQCPACKFCFFIKSSRLFFQFKFNFVAISLG